MWSAITQYLDGLSLFAWCGLAVVIMVLEWRALQALERWLGARRDRARAAGVGQSLSSFDRATRREDRRNLSARLRADVAQRGYSLRFNHDDRSDWPIQQSAGRVQSQVDGAGAQAELREQSGYQTTRLSVPPRDAA